MSLFNQKAKAPAVPQSGAASPSAEATESKKAPGFLSRQFAKVTGSVPYKIAKWATSPVWGSYYPAKLLWKHDHRKLAAAWTAVTLGVQAVVATGAGIYGTLAVADTSIPVLNFPASSGHWEGRIVRDSNKGIWPFSRREILVRTGEADHVYPLSVHWWQFGLIKNLEQAESANGRFEFDYNDCSRFLPQSKLGEIQPATATNDVPIKVTSILGQLQSTDHLLVGIHPLAPK
jgi:hypothetical protein